MKKAVFLLCLMAWLQEGCSGSRPENLGVVDGRLAPCPDTPNCVSTLSNDPAHRMEPMRYTGSDTAAMEKLAAVISRSQRARILSRTDNYIHAEYVSRIWRFADDVELYLDNATGTIHFRSASRMGYSDLGVNRRRMEAIRRAFTRK